MGNKKRFIVSGGGTGGHIFPAISIAKAIMRIDPNAEIMFVGAHGRMEMEKVPAAGFKIIGLPIQGLQRSSIFKNISFLPKLLISLFKCRSIIKEFKPDAVIGVGGYASAPLLRTAQRMGIPTLIQEQNSYAGVTNKWLSRNANCICVAYDGMEKFFPKDKIVFTGNPVRQDLQSLTASATDATNFFGLNPNLRTVLVVGGSLGARTINDSIVANLDLLLKQRIQIIWQTGKIYYDKVLTEVAKSNVENQQNLHIYQFINRMDLAYTAADVIVSRAGAGTISELCLVGKPTILVPSPNVAEDHQTKNAQALTQRGAAVMVPDSEAVASIGDKIKMMLENDDKMVSMRIKMREMGIKNSDELIANEVFKFIKK